MTKKKFTVVIVIIAVITALAILGVINGSEVVSIIQKILGV